MTETDLKIVIERSVKTGNVFGLSIRALADCGKHRIVNSPIWDELPPRYVRREENPNGNHEDFLDIEKLKAFFADRSCPVCDPTKFIAVTIFQV